MQDMWTEIVVATLYDGHARKEMVAVTNGELEGGVVGNHQQIDTVPAVFGQQDIGLFFLQCWFVKSPAVEVFHGQFDIQVRRLQPLDEPLLDVVAPTVSGVVGVDIQDMFCFTVVVCKACVCHTQVEAPSQQQDDEHPGQRRSH
jgi:hypothetical protein